MLPSTGQDAAKTAFSGAVGGLHVLLLFATSLKETSFLNAFVLACWLYTSPGRCRRDQSGPDLNLIFQSMCSWRLLICLAQNQGVQVGWGQAARDVWRSGGVAPSEENREITEWHGTCPTATTKMTRRPWGPEHTLSKRTTAAFRGNWQVSRTSSWRLSLLHYLAERWWYLY